MEDIEIPEFFICPISLHIMKDPVTATTGITYDRESIEHWLFTAKNTTCPVTKQPLPKDSDLTPNHTLRRVIQTWCTENASKGVQRIPTPKPPLNKSQVTKLITHDLRAPQLQLQALQKLEFLAVESARNRKCMVEAGVVKAMFGFIVLCFNKLHASEGLEEALSILHLLRIRSLVADIKPLLIENDKIIEALTWVLDLESELYKMTRTNAILVLKTVISATGTTTLERLSSEFFKRIVKVLRPGAITQKGVNDALQILLETCPLGTNRAKMVEEGAVFELIEHECASPERRTTELIMAVLFHLCSCAAGRAAFLSHAAGVAVVGKRILSVSLATDDRAILILCFICKYSGTDEVLQEMLKVGTVSKLCMMLQVEHAAYLKQEIRGVLKAHSNEEKSSY
ncbi:U-box domain [Dillenia turbinata]|uniref:U-box domain-containing protein n=1 Tax=Dillenia turbinata TaxID=194707 RepID=A0AAN8W142_9MAGN